LIADADVVSNLDFHDLGGADEIASINKRRE
jgi:hypothetical protein